MKKRKINFTKIICIFLIIYIGFNITNALIKKNTNTLVLKSEVVKDSLKKRGLIIRDECLIESSMDGTIKRNVKDGEKIKKGDNIAYIYNDNIDEKSIDKLKNLRDEIKTIETGNTKLMKNDVKKINEKVEKISLNLQKNLLDGKINIEKDFKEIDKLLKDKRKLIDSDLNNKSLKTKEDEEIKVSKLINENSDVVKAKNSGIVSYKFDGYEKNLNLQNLKNIKYSDIENTNSEYKKMKIGTKIKKGEPVVRIVNNLKQYVVISCNEKEANKLKVGQSVVLVNKDKKINSNVYDKYEDNNDYIVILSISEENMEIYDTRVKEFDIIYKSTEGLKVPKSAFVKLNGKKGVYVISETGEEKFVELQGTYYEDEEYIIIDYYKNHINGIKCINIYDELILNPKGKKFYKK